MKENLLAQLNQSQREAVEYIDGASLVIAGAGSGKTRVLTYKIAYLLENGLNPWNILALTFTNKAANEMKQRIGELVGMERARYLQMGTFHSVFSRILRVEGSVLGYQSNYTIYDESDSRSLLKSIIKGLGLDEKKYKPALIHQRISMAKNRQMLPEHYMQNRDFYSYDREAGIPETGMIYNAYQARLKSANAMDFDDLLLQTYLLFCQYPDIRRKYEEIFEFVLVDEYQDTNHVQQEIMLQLTGERQRVCVVGDDAQSIYAFRGANIDNILNFQNHFRKAKLFKLEKNYRSTQRIVQAANSLIKHNVKQIPKDVYSENDEGEKLMLKQAYSDREEAIIVSKDIERMTWKNHLNYSDFAILYRTNSQSRSFEEQLRRSNIPYRIYGGLSFYQRKEIKDAIAYFRLIVNPDDEEAFRRIINYPTRGIGETTVKKILACAIKNNISLWTLIQSPTKYGLDINKRTAEKLHAFSELINSFIEKAGNVDVYELGSDVLRASGMSADIYIDRSPENLSRQENLEELLSSMQEFAAVRREEGRENEVYLADFLQEVSLMSEIEDDQKANTEKVTLMTVHSAKGLEFPVVFVVGLEENIFPSPMSTDSARKLEEERRLLYVAITRAKRYCILTCAKNRNRYGKMEFNAPSRFLRDIDPAYLAVDKGKDIFPQRKDTVSFARQMEDKTPYSYSAYKERKTVFSQPEHPSSIHSGRLQRIDKAISQSSSNAPQTSSLKEGTMIEHERFGIGKIIAIEGNGENTKATVEFRNAGIKQLLLKFARFKIMN